MWLIVIVALLSLVLVYSLRIPQQIKYRHIPGDPVIPLYGHILAIRKDKLNNELNLATKYPILHKRFVGGLVSIAITDIEAFKKVSSLQSKGYLFSSVFEKYGEDFSKYAIFNANGPIWQDLRILLQPSFNLASIRTYIQPINQATDNQITYMKQKEKAGELIDIFDSAKMLTLTVIVNTLFGINLQSFNKEDEDRLHELSKATTKLMERTQRNIFIDYLAMVPELTPIIAIFLQKIGLFEKQNQIDQGPGRTVLKIISEKQSISETELNQMIQKLSQGQSLDKIAEWSEQKGPGLAAKLLCIGQVQGKRLTQDQITANLTILVIAGHDTTAATIAFAIHCLSLDKNRESILLKEIDQFSNKKDIEESDFSKMPYTMAVINESLRLYSPILQNFRCVKSKGFKIGEYEIPKNTNITLPIRAIHLNERYYEKPLEFIPERWLNNQDLKAKNFHAFIPFGYGPRQCLGLRLAISEAQIALAKIYQNFVFEIPKGKEKIELAHQFTLIAKSQMLIKPISRNNTK